MRLKRVPVSVETAAPDGRTNAYLLGDERALLVDPARASDELDRAVADRTVTDVAVTHHHPDHVGAVDHYARVHGATVWARLGREAAFERATGRAPDRTFTLGTRIETDGGPVEVVDTPGHAPEHVAFRFVGEGGPAYLVGDLAVAEGSVVVGAPEGDMRAYLSSLRRLWARDPDVCHPGHGPAIEDPRATCRRLIDHRRKRERAVLAAVEGGARTLAEITDRAYEKDVSEVRELAEATVRAHLGKLAAEGHVGWDGERARPA